MTCVPFLIHLSGNGIRTAACGGLFSDWDRQDRKTIGADILTVQYAWPVGKPLVDSLGEGIWEVRSRLSNRIARTLFALIDEEIVVLHGFIKKTQQAPKQDLALAKKRKKQYLKSHE